MWLARANASADLHVSPRFATYYFAPNLTIEPWRGNRNLRAALDLAIDRQALVERITLAGEVPSFTYVPPGAGAYVSALPAWAGWTQGQREAEAQRLLNERSFDLFIVDNLMPERTGLELIRDLVGAIPDGERPQVLMMTAHATIESAIAAMKLGAFDYLQKPFEIDELLVVASRALEQKGRDNVKEMIEDQPGRKKGP